MYCFDRVSDLVKAKPELKDIEPFKTVMSGDREAISKLTLPDLEKIAGYTLSGMSEDQFIAQDTPLECLFPLNFHTDTG